MGKPRQLISVERFEEISDLFSEWQQGDQNQTFEEFTQELGVSKEELKFWEASPLL